MLTESQQALLAAELSLPLYSGLDSQAAFALLHSPVTVTSSVPAKLELAGIVGLLSQVSLRNVISLPSLIDIRDKIISQDRVAVGLWSQLLVAAGLITSDEHSSIIGLLNAMEDVTVQGETRLCTAFSGVPGMPNAIEQEDFVAVWNSLSHD